jgi:enediyne polyketide synthase
VILVTGGGKGIGAECALALARHAGARLVVLGRSRQEQDRDLAENLRRFEAMGVTCEYAQADVTRFEDVERAIHDATSRLGEITALLHAAGVNEPMSLRNLDRAAFERTLAPKVGGFRNLLAALDPGRLRLLVSFGSVIARIGMRGEADYAVANACLTELTEQFQARHPACRCLALEWSVWASVGMGERLGRVEALAREGVGPIPTEAGVDQFLDLVSRAGRSTTVVVAGRLGEPPTLEVERPPLPAFRFLERALVDYPGIELVAEANLEGATDPYVADHVFAGERVFPAVLGLEAMAQAAAGLLRLRSRPRWRISDVRFERPVIVEAAGPTTIRLAALARGPARVEVALRCAHTSFRVDHFRATFEFAPDAGTPDDGGRVRSSLGGQLLPIDPAADLYSALLFQRGRFQRITGYTHLEASRCLAEISAGDREPWFGPGRPEELTLGDAAARDAAIHAVQACIPHAPLLPIGVDRIVIDCAESMSPTRVQATERSAQGDLFIYDLVVEDEAGCVRERWEGLRLRAVSGLRNAGPWCLPLLVPYLERQVRALSPAERCSIAVAQSPRSAPEEQPLRALTRMLATSSDRQHRTDGKPLVAGGLEVSASYSGGLAVSMTARQPVGCDAEQVVPRSQLVWRDLLGAERFEVAECLMRELGDDLDRAATRIWAAVESLEKAGVAETGPLVYSERGPDGWAQLRCGDFSVTTGPARIRGEEGETVFAFALPSRERPADAARPSPSPTSARTYEYRHVVGFEETNLVGNVYFTNPLRWQGRCRELFLREHAPSVLDDLARGLAMVTTHVSCDFVAELKPFDEVSVRMSLEAQGPNHLELYFEYWRISPKGSELVARGKQGVSCMNRTDFGLVRTPLPEALRNALWEFSHSSEPSKTRGTSRP